MPCIHEWVQLRRENLVEVEAWNTMMLLLDAHQLYAQDNFGEAVDLLLSGRQMGQHSAPVTYAAFASSWRFHTFLPVLATFDKSQNESSQIEQAARVAADRVRGMDSTLAGTALSVVKRHVYSTILLALRCLHKWQLQRAAATAQLDGRLAQAQQGGKSNGHFAKAQARALDSLVCQLSSWLAVPVDVQLEAQTLFRLLND